jgi:hypothetical protein
MDLVMVIAGTDEEAPRMERKPSAHYPKNYVLQHHDSPAMLLDMTPEIAADIIPEIIPSQSVTPPPELADASRSSDDQEAVGLLPEATPDLTANQPAGRTRFFAWRGSANGNSSSA